MKAARLALLTLAPLGAECPSPHEPPPPDSSVARSETEAESAPAPPKAPSTPALSADPPIFPLHVEGFADAVVSMPTGATGPRPIVIATHGMWDFPEGLCDNWRFIVGARAWVLCVRGTPMPDHTFYYKSGPALRKEIDAGVAALEARFGAYVDDGPMLYTGFSLGAILGAWIVTHDPARFPWAILTEGGEDKFSPDSAGVFARGGGKHVLFACGLKERVGQATYAAQVLTKAGAESRVVLGKLPDTGQFIHWYNGPVADEEKAQLDWLLDGDARWSIPP